jgi:hypothetical protein
MWHNTSFIYCRSVAWRKVLQVPNRPLYVINYRAAYRQNSGGHTTLYEIHGVWFPKKETVLGNRGGRRFSYCGLWRQSGKTRHKESVHTKVQEFKELKCKAEVIYQLTYWRYPQALHCRNLLSYEGIDNASTFLVMLTGPTSSQQR